MSLTKFLLLTNEPVDLSDFRKVLETVLERFNPESDLLVLSDTAQNQPDEPGYKQNQGSKGVLMGIGRPVRELPRSYNEGVLPGITDDIPYCGGCLAVSGASYIEDPELPQRLITALREQNTAWPLVVLVDNAADTVRTQTSFLWSVFTRFNPASDLYADSVMNRHQISYKLPLVIDARVKPGYPDELFPSEDIVTIVDQNWKTYFPSGLS